MISQAMQATIKRVVETADFRPLFDAFADDIELRVAITQRAPVSDEGRGKKLGNPRRDNRSLRNTMNLRTSRTATLLLCAAGLIATVASEVTAADGTGNARAQGEIVGVFTGRFANGMPVYQFPPVTVVANRKAELAKIEREEQLARARAMRAKPPARPPV